jgi:hypothetical protein
LTVVVVCVGLVAAASGCASSRRPGGLDGGSSAVGLDPASTGMSCTPPDAAGTAQPTSPAPSPQPLPADFAPVSASRCILKMVTVPGDGEWQVHEEQEASSQLDVLVRALRQPSEPGNATVSCSAVGMAPVVITLTDGHGTTISPAIPHDACNFPLQTVLHTIQTLPWKTVRDTRVHQTRSQLEIDSGCPGGYKPMIAIEAAAGTRRSADPGPSFPGTPPTSLAVCRYTLDASSTMSGLDGSGTFTMGTLATTARLTGSNLNRLLAAMDAAGAVTGSCDMPQVPFAVLSTQDGSGPWVMVELGGCNRGLDGDGHLRQLNAATIAILKD